MIPPYYECEKDYYPLAMLGIFITTMLMFRDDFSSLAGDFFRERGDNIIKMLMEGIR